MTTQNDLERVWAEGGGFTDPGAVKYNTGWIAEIPTYQNFNYVLKNNSQNIKVLAEQHIFEWQDNISYVSGSRVRYNDVIYTCLLDNLNVAPDTDTTRWTLGIWYGDPTVKSNAKGLNIDFIYGTGGTTWTGSDATVVNTIPFVHLQGADAAETNWGLAVVGGQLVAVDAGTSVLPDNRSLGIAEPHVHRIFHEGSMGPGSGLDSDTLDGIEGAEYVRRTIAQTITGEHTHTGIVNIRSALDLDDGTKLRIGSSDDLQLHHTGGGNYIDVVTGDLFIRDGTATRYTFGTAAGDFTATGKIEAAGDVQGSQLISDVAVGTPPLAVTSNTKVVNLNVDRLDDLDSTQFLRSDVDDTAEGVITFEEQSVHEDGILANENIVMQAATGTGTGADTPDIVFQDSAGTEVGRLYRSATDPLWRDNATATPGIIWHSENDGTGSGLDADYLDGFQGSQYLRSDATDQKTAGHLTFYDGVDLYMGTGNDIRWHFNGSNLYTDLNTGNWYVRDGTTTRFTFDDAGHFTATGNVTTARGICSRTPTSSSDLANKAYVDSRVGGTVSKGSRSSTGTWTISGLTAGKPVYFMFQNTENSDKSVRFTMHSGWAYATGHNSGSPFNMNHNNNEWDASPPGFTYIANATSATVVIQGISSNCYVRAWQ